MAPRHLCRCVMRDQAGDVPPVAHLIRRQTPCRPASSGRNQRHRLSRYGNRRLNRAIHIIAVTQARMHPPARAYMARRIEEGKTNREAQRALKRYIARAIFATLKNAPAPQLAPL